MFKWSSVCIAFRSICCSWGSVDEHWYNPCASPAITFILNTQYLLIFVQCQCSVPVQEAAHPDKAERKVWRSGCSWWCPLNGWTLKGQCWDHAYSSFMIHHHWLIQQLLGHQLTSNTSHIHAYAQTLQPDTVSVGQKGSKLKLTDDIKQWGVEHSVSTRLDIYTLQWKKDIRTKNSSAADHV